MKNVIPWKRHSESPLTRPDEFREPFEALHHQVNRLFEDFFSDIIPGKSFDLWRGFRGGELSPSFEMSESDDAVTITAELPGMDEKDIEVKLDDDVLTVRGEKREEKRETEKDMVLSERRYGSFERMIPLPHGVKVDDAKATFKKGVLSITMPKTPEAKKASRRIDIAA